MDKDLHGLEQILPNMDNIQPTLAQQLVILSHNDSGSRDESELVSIVELFCRDRSDLSDL